LSDLTDAGKNAWCWTERRFFGWQLLHVITRDYGRNGTRLSRKHWTQHFVIPKYSFLLIGAGILHLTVRLPDLLCQSSRVMAEKRGKYRELTFLGRDLY
jgi:hypothetical protein